MSLNLNPIPLIEETDSLPPPSPQSESAQQESSIDQELQNDILQISNAIVKFVKQLQDILPKYFKVLDDTSEDVIVSFKTYNPSLTLINYESQSDE